MIILYGGGQWKDVRADSFTSSEGETPPLGMHLGIVEGATSEENVLDVDGWNEQFDLQNIHIIATCRRIIDTGTYYNPKVRYTHINTCTSTHMLTCTV